MAIEANSFEFQLFLILTIIVISYKGFLSIYLGKKVIEKNKDREKFKFDFIASIFILMICLFISRILYMYFDFFLTELDSSQFWKFPNIIYWKFATLISAFGFSMVLFVIDKQALNFKFKGILAILYIATTLFQFFYPVNSQADFEFISSFSLIAAVFGVIIPILFIYIGNRAPGLRRTSYIIAFSVIIYGIGGLFVGEGVLGPLRAIFGQEIHILIFFVFLITKIVGLGLMTYGVSKFTI